MDEPIDAVALGLKRGPRGAVGVVLLVVAIPIALVAARSGGEREALGARQKESSGELAAEPLTPLPKLPPVTKRPRVKQPKAVALKPQSTPALLVAAREPEQVQVIEKTEPKPASEPVIAEAPQAAPPPPPQLESVAKLEDTEEAERDGNGEAIARFIAAEKRAAVRSCFESELKASPKLHGTVVVELDLAPPNRVNGVRVNDDLERAAFTSCVAATMKDVKFTALDEEISVSVPYVLTPAAK